MRESRTSGSVSTPYFKILLIINGAICLTTFLAVFIMALVTKKDELGEAQKTIFRKWRTTRPAAAGMALVRRGGLAQDP